MGMYVIGTPRRDQKCLGCSRSGWFIHKTRSATVHHERTLWINERASLLLAARAEDSGGFTNFFFGWTSFTLKQDTPPRTWETGLRFFMQLFWGETKNISQGNTKQTSNSKYFNFGFTAIRFILLLY